MSKANYLGIAVHLRDFENIHILAERVKNVLEVANGYYFYGANDETEEWLSRDGNNLAMILKITKELEKT